MTPNEIYQEVRRRMAEQNLKADEEFFGMVDEVISDYIDRGLMAEDDDNEAFREKLELMWKQRAREEEEGQGF